MTDRRRARAQRIYGLLLRLFPPAFRRRFEPQLLDLFRDAHHAASARGRVALLIFWIRIIADAVVSALSERIGRHAGFRSKGAFVEGWPQDVRYAVRMLARRPALSIVVIATLALGIGANVAIFSLVNTVLLRALPYPDADRLVMIWEQRLETGDVGRPVPPGNFFDWKARSVSFEEIAWSRDSMFNVTGDGPPETLIGYRFSANMLQVLGARPMLGRGFTEDDDRPGAPGVVLLSHELWHRRYGGDPHIVGRTLTLDGESHTAIGVMPAWFQHPQGTEIWAPIALPPAVVSRRDLTVLRLVGRLKPGVSREQAETELNAVYSDIARQHPEVATGLSASLEQLGDPGDATAMLMVLAGGVGLVLLIACANVANLLLADATARRRELAVRGALGASRYRVVRQELTQSMLLALIGGTLGAFVTWWVRDGLLILFPTTISNLDLPRVEQIDLSLAVLGFALAVSVTTGLLFGFLPAWNVSAANLQGALREGDRAASSPRRTHAALVVVEVALSMILMAGALLMVQSFMRLQQQRLGFEADRVLSARLSLPRYRYPDDAALAVFARRLIEQLRQIPGVETVGLTNYLPLSGWWGSIAFDIEGRPRAQPGSEPSADLRIASEDYFRSMGIPLVAGRTFTARDDPSAPAVVIVNQTFARRYLPDGEPIGTRLLLDLGRGEQPHEIIGIVGDVKSFGLEEATHPDIFFSYWQVPYELVGIALRTSGDPGSLTSRLREAVWSIDRDQPITHLLPLTELVSESLTFRRVGMVLASGFGLFALVLAAIGLYGVLSYSVNRRTREIGIRVALGARRGDVARLVIRDGLAMTAVGVTVGLGAALVLSRFLRSLLYEVRPADPVTYVAVAIVLVIVACLATWLPARRASAVDPITALRMD